MKTLGLLKRSLSLLAIGLSTQVFALPLTPNQTDTTTPVNPSQKDVPFKVRIELADFQLPNGIQSYTFARYNGKWLLLSGRTNGMHTFMSTPDNFPPKLQNQVLYVVDPKTGDVRTRSLSDPNSGLTQQQIDLLSMTANQWNQEGKTIYIVGGYGVDTATGNFFTSDTLTAIDVPGLMHWVTEPFKNETAAQHIRQITNPALRVTGGAMFKIGEDNPSLLVFGQDFEGFYFDPTSDGIYTQQVRRFKIIDDGKHLAIKVLPSDPAIPDPNFRRRDLNVVPVIKKEDGKLKKGLVALSGVFTPDEGIWTVPVKINNDGKTFMANPADASTFKQGMNNYSSATLGLFSKKAGDMFTVIFGGITFGQFVNGQFVTDPTFALPFTNQISAVKINKHGKFSQYLMNTQYPVILSTGTNAGNQFLFGTDADFIPADDAPYFSEVEVVKLDKLKKDGELVGYIVGGIASTLPNPGNSSLTSTIASPYIFKVIVEPTK
jgi:hypothetical protein